MENISLSCSGNRSFSSDTKVAFKSILADVSDLEEEIINNNLQTMQKTSEILRDVDNLYATVDHELPHPGESFLDSKVLCATSVLAVRCSESISGNLNKYDKSELAKHMSSNPDYWEFPFPHEVQSVPYLYGTFEPTPPEERKKAPRKKLEKQKQATLKVAKTKENVEESVKDREILKKVRQFVKRACRDGPLCYFKLALDPTSFTKSIENIYHLSFLVAEGVLEVSIDKGTGLPIARMRSSDGGQGGDSKNQFILSMDMNLYKSLIKAFGIREPMMVIDRD